MYAKPSQNGEQFVYVCRVLTGEFTCGWKGLVEPPIKKALTNLRFDSVADSENKPSMFVIFNDADAYPEYLITFNWTASFKDSHE